MFKMELRKVHPFGSVASFNSQIQPTGVWLASRLEGIRSDLRLTSLGGFQEEAALPSDEDPSRKQKFEKPVFAKRPGKCVEKRYFLADARRFAIGFEDETVSLDVRFIAEASVDALGPRNYVNRIACEADDTKTQ